MAGVDRRRGLGVFSVLVGVLLFLGMTMGLGRALRGEDVSGFFLAPFLLTGALVCLGVGFHQLWGHSPSTEGSEDTPVGPSRKGDPPSR